MKRNDPRRSVGVLAIAGQSLKDSGSEGTRVSQIIVGHYYEPTEQRSHRLGVTQIL